VSSSPAPTACRGSLGRSRGTTSVGCSTRWTGARPSASATRQPPGPAVAVRANELRGGPVGGPLWPLVRTRRRATRHPRVHHPLRESPRLPEPPSLRRGPRSAPGRGVPDTLVRTSDAPARCVNTAGNWPITPNRQEREFESWIRRTRDCRLGRVVDGFHGQPPGSGIPRTMAGGGGSAPQHVGARRAVELAPNPSLREPSNGPWPWVGAPACRRDDLHLETVTSFHVLPRLGYFVTGELGQGSLRGNLEIVVEPTLILYLRVHVGHCRRRGSPPALGVCGVVPCTSLCGGGRRRARGTSRPPSDELRRQLHPRG
jgi:hypothetical protein